MPIAELCCRTQRSDLGQKGVGQPLCLLLCRADTKQRTASGTEGMLVPFTGVCTGAAQC